MVDQRLLGQVELDAQRWEAHKTTHADLAAALREYKADANEWRKTLADLRETFLTRATFDAEHRALASDLTGDLKVLSGLLDAITGRVNVIDQARITREAADNALALAHAEQQRRDDASRARQQWTIGIAVALTSILISAAVAIVIKVLVP